MSRTKKVFKKNSMPDPVFANRLVSKLINKVMRNGKKSTAAGQVYAAFELLKTKFPDQEPVKVFEQAMTLVAPKMEVRSRRVGGASYQVPQEVRGDRKVHLAMRWVIDGARSRSNKEHHTFSQKLAAEITDILNNTGNAIKKRDQVQKMADANRAFAHLKW
jgi:small subunit ribosomal protein S7